MDVKKLVKEKQAVQVPMGALLKQYNELVKWKSEGSILTLFFHQAITNFMNSYREQIEQTFRDLDVVNKKHLKEKDGVYLKDPQGGLVFKETTTVEDYNKDCEPYLNKMVEVRL